MSKQKTQCSSSSSSLTKLHIKLPSSALSPTSTSSSFSPNTTSSSTSSLLSTRKRPLRLDDINTQLTCVICNGYFVDATTIIECLHSFCRSCIVKHLKTSKSCPICDSEVPIISSQYIRSDITLQDIVYKLIPDVYKREKQRRYEFCLNHPEALNLYSSVKERTEFTLDHSVYYQPQDKISLSLEYGFGDNQIPDNEPHSDSNFTSTCNSNLNSTCNSNSASTNNHSNNQVNEKLQSESDTKKRYLLCPAGLSIYHLKKFISTKYALPSTFQVDIMYFKDNLNDEFTLMDVAYIYSWRRSEPMRLFYKIREREKPIKKKLKVSHQSNVSNNNSHKNNKSNNSKEKESQSCKSKLSCVNQEEENQICSSSTMRCTNLRSNFNSPTTTTRSSFNSPTTTRSSFNSSATTRSNFNSPTTTKSNFNSPTTTKSGSTQNSNKKVKTTAKTCEKSKKCVEPTTTTDISLTSLSTVKLYKTTYVSSHNSTNTNTTTTTCTNATSTKNTNTSSSSSSLSSSIPVSTQHPRAQTSRCKTSTSQSASSLAVSTVSEPEPLPLPAPLSPASTASTPSPKPLVISDTFDRSIDIKSNNVTDSHSSRSSSSSSSSNSPITIEKPEQRAVVSSSNLSINIINCENHDFKTTLPTPPSTLPSPSGISIPSLKKEDITTNSISSSASSTSSSSSLFNAPLDLSTHKKDSLTNNNNNNSNSNSNSNNCNSSITPSLNAIYDIQSSKPKQCLNPAVLDKHRGLFPLSNAPNKQHPSFKILPTNSRQTNPSLQSPSSSSSTLNNLIENLKKQKESSLNQSMQSQNTKTSKKETAIVSSSSMNNTVNSHSNSSLLSIKKDSKPTNSIHNSPQSPPLCLSLTNLIATKKQQEKSAVISSSIVNSNHISLNTEITSKKNHRPTTTAIIEPAMITSSSINHKSTSISSNKKQEKSTNCCYSIVNSNHHIQKFPPNTLIPIEKIKISPVVSSSISSGKSNGNYNSQSSSSSASSSLNSFKKSPEKSISQSIVKANSIKSSSSNHHHHHHHSNHTKTYSVITTDPHSYAPKIVIRNIGSPPLMSSHLQHHHH